MRLRKTSAEALRGTAILTPGVSTAAGVANSRPGAATYTYSTEKRSALKSRTFSTVAFFPVMMMSHSALLKLAVNGAADS